MDPNETVIKYSSVKIPDRQQQANQAGAESLTRKNNVPESVSVDNSLFYEIEYTDYPVKGVGRFVLKSRKIEPSKKDDIREKFYAMREISTNHRFSPGYSKFYDKRVQQNNAAIFYKQGIFMKDFTDSYSEKAPFSSYFPNYQMMGYDQLRTYFTWRTNVRAGNITDISVSYAFLYIYELLNNIGTENPQDGLQKLVIFWRAFREYNKNIDKYVIQWFKDYHIYYELPHSFKDFAEENNLSGYYPKMVDTDDPFDLYCAISKYDIRKSSFYTEGNVKLITDCFNFIIKKIEQVFSDNELNFNNSVFIPTRKMSSWQPFRNALFYEWLKQPDRRVVLSQNDIYVCNRNKWEYSTVITSECGRQLIGYIMKKMESELRKLTKYKFKNSANINMVAHPVMEELKKKDLSLEDIITSAVMEFYREATKIVVSVDYASLNKIRQEALSTQKKLSVELSEDGTVALPGNEDMPASLAEDKIAPASEHMRSSVAADTAVSVAENLHSFVIADTVVSDTENVHSSDKGAVALPGNEDVPVNHAEDVISPVSEDLPAPFAVAAVPSAPEDINKNEPLIVSDPWECFGNSLDHIEKQALIILLSAGQDIKKYADDNGIMLEVLVDGINGKAMDFIGDSILDEDFNVYDDYMEKVKKMVV